VLQIICYGIPLDNLARKHRARRKSLVTTSARCTQCHRVSHAILFPTFQDHVTAVVAFVSRVHRAFCQDHESSPLIPRVSGPHMPPCSARSETNFIARIQHLRCIALHKSHNIEYIYYMLPWQRWPEHATSLQQLNFPKRFVAASPLGFILISKPIVPASVLVPSPPGPLVHPQMCVNST
jgi:hypothetical protein